jgi:hypothetical protein
LSSLESPTSTSDTIRLPGRKLSLPHSPVRRWIPKSAGRLKITAITNSPTVMPRTRATLVRLSPKSGLRKPQATAVSTVRVTKTTRFWRSLTAAGSRGGSPNQPLISS